MYQKKNDQTVNVLLKFILMTALQLYG